MIITTKRLSIACSITSDWVDVTIYPRHGRNATTFKKTVISYDEDSIESDVDISELIGIFNGEPTWRRLYLSGYALEAYDNDELYPYTFNPLKKEIYIGHKIDSFTVSWEDLWAKGVQELKFITEDFTSGYTELSIITMVRLEALKRVRQAIRNASKEDIAYLQE